MRDINQELQGFSKIRLVGVLAAISLIAGLGISIQKILQWRASDLASNAEIQPAAIQPSTQTQIVILTPNSDQQIDCLKFGGGLGCFDQQYKPKTPESFGDDEEEKKGWKFNPSDAAWRLW